MSWYLTLRPASSQAEPADTVDLIAYLDAQPELRQIGPVEFESVPGQPQMLMILAKTNPNGGYSSDGKFIPRIDIVELICPYSEPPAWYDALAARIAAFLGWQAIEESESRQIWPRQENRL
ncbi:hypothetical protein [Lysobacter sp. CA199]|uniref:hypothetical protein n=1 Tax=Lysobacter sp. CA199 TaxID=3455608 RepID=UPI003F8D1C6E